MAYVAMYRVLQAARCKRLSGEADDALKRRFRHYDIRPQRIHQFVFGDDPAGVADEIDKQIKNPRLDFLPNAAQRQFAGSFIVRSVQMSGASPPSGATIYLIEL